MALRLAMWHLAPPQHRYQNVEGFWLQFPPLRIKSQRPCQTTEFELVMHGGDQRSRQTFKKD